MNRLELIREYKQIAELLDGDLVVSAGAALVMLGIREECGDIDVDVSIYTWERLFTPEQRSKAPNGPLPKLGMDFHPALITRDSWKDIDGVKVYEIDHLIKQKQELIARPDRFPEKLPQDRLDLAGLHKLKCK